MSSTSQRKKAEAFRAETVRTTTVSGRYEVFNPDSRGLVTGDGGKVLEIFDVLPGMARVGSLPSSARPEGTFTFVVTFVPHGKKKEI